MTTHLPQAELSREEALQLWLSERSEYAKEQMVLANQNLVYSELKKLKLPRDDDLFMTGIYGLCRAVVKYDRSKQVTFSTFAVPLIHNEIVRPFRKKRIVPAMSIDEPLREYPDLCLKDAIPDRRDYEMCAICKIGTNRVENVLGELTYKQARVTKLLLDGYERPEIARMLNVSHQNVSDMMIRIRRKIKRAKVY